MLLTITGLNNHVRFISVAEGHCTFESNDAHNVFIDSPAEPINPISYEKLFMFMVMNYSLPGIPSIFYGDEFGQIGEKGVDSKRDMKFHKALSKSEIHLKSRISILNKIRSTYNWWLRALS